MVLCCCEAWVYRGAVVKMNGKEELGLENQAGIVLHQELWDVAAALRTRHAGEHRRT